ncbi:MAG: M14 family zinc carboxypeptidase, partial [Bdellovibrionota bacterium]
MRNQGWALTALSVLFFSTSAFAYKASYKEVKAFMSDVVSKHADTTSLFELGGSDSGDKVIGLKIGDGPVKNLVVATHHGNEYGSTEVAKGFAAAMAVAPIKGQTLYVIPVLNIGGYNQLRREEMGADKQSHDPNRDYPGPCGTDGPY